MLAKFGGHFSFSQKFKIRKEKYAYDKNQKRIDHWRKTLHPKTGNWKLRQL